MCRRQVLTCVRHARSAGGAVRHHPSRCGRNSRAGAARLASTNACTRASSSDLELHTEEAGGEERR